MRGWRVWLLPCAGVVGCTAPNPEFGDEDGGTAAEVTSAGPNSTSATTSGTASVTSSAGTGEGGSTTPTGEGDGSTVGDTTVGGDGSSSTGTPSDPGQCWDSESFELLIHVHKNGVDYGPCASSINITGPVVSAEGGYFEMESCGGCEPCGGDVFAFDLGVFPETTAYDPALPGCVNVVTTSGTDMIAPDACSTTGIVIRSPDASMDPVYIGSAGMLVPPVAAPVEFDFDLVATSMTCECWGMCCLIEPGLYRLAFPNAGVLGIDEGDSVAVPIGANQTPYEFSNLGSHIHPNCAHRPHIDYVIRRAG